MGNGLAEFVFLGFVRVASLDVADQCRAEGWLAGADGLERDPVAVEHRNGWPPRQTVGGALDVEGSWVGG